MAYLFALSPVTVPEVFAKFDSPQFLSFKVANEYLLMRFCLHTFTFFSNQDYVFFVLLCFFFFLFFGFVEIRNLKLENLWGTGQII